MTILGTLLLAAAAAAPVTAPATDAAALTALLDDFLAGASRNDLATHERFWADDVVYARSAGKLTTKAEILAGLRERPAAPDNAAEPPTTYT